MTCGSFWSTWMAMRCGLPSAARPVEANAIDRKSTRLNSSHQIISYAVFCLKKKIFDKRAILLDANHRRMSLQLEIAAHIAQRDITPLMCDQNKNLIADNVVRIQPSSVATVL